MADNLELAETSGLDTREADHPRLGFRRHARRSRRGLLRRFDGRFRPDVRLQPAACRSSRRSSSAAPEAPTARCWRARARPRRGVVDLFSRRPGSSRRLLVLIVVLLVRPQGLFAPAGRCMSASSHRASSRWSAGASSGSTSAARGIYGIFTLGMQLHVGFTGLSTSHTSPPWRSAPTRWRSSWSRRTSRSGSRADRGRDRGVLRRHRRCRRCGCAATTSRSRRSRSARIRLCDQLQLTGGDEGAARVHEHLADPLDADHVSARPRVAVLPRAARDRPWVILLVSPARLAADADAVGARAARDPRGRGRRRVARQAVYWYKLQSLAIGASLASIAGYLLALDLGYLSPEEFTPDNTFIAFTMLLVGGLEAIAALSSARSSSR